MKLIIIKLHQAAGSSGVHSAWSLK